jgi:hypothetical protein
MNLVAVGIGAGLVSALLFSVIVTGHPLAAVLSLVAPLPVFIAAMGWNHRAGLLAAAAGGIVMALVFRATAGIGYVVGWALPAWWLGYLALLGRPDRNGTIEWYPVGRLLAWIAGTAAAVTVAFLITSSGGDYEAHRSSTVATAQRLFESAPFIRPGPDGDAKQIAADLARIFAAGLPALMASAFVMILAVNLWIAGRVVAISGRLPRAWPELPAARMPIESLGLLLGSLGVSFAPGFLGAFGLAFTAALLIAFVLQALAFTHDATRGRPGRPMILVAVYVSVLFISQAALPLLAILGMTDAGLNLRKRFGPGSAGPRPLP